MSWDMITLTLVNTFNKGYMHILHFTSLNMRHGISASSPCKSYVKYIIIWGTTAYFQFSTISFQTICEVRFSIYVKYAQENKSLLSFMCVYPSGSAERCFHSGTLWPVRSQRSIPGSAAGQRVRGTAEHAQLLSCAPAGTGGGSEPAGGAQTGDGSLQKDAGEDDGAASSCWEQTQKGKSGRLTSCYRTHMPPYSTLGECSASSRSSLKSESLLESQIPSERFGQQMKSDSQCQDSNVA